MEEAQKQGVGEARFSLTIRGEELPFDQISDWLELTPTKVVRMGDILNRLPRFVASSDEWIYAIDLTNPTGTDAELNALLESIRTHKDQLDEMAKVCQVSLRMYVQSDRAQIAYRLMPETLAGLMATGLPLDVTSLSWGEIGV